MASEITSLLQHGWNNLWKNRILWIFSSLTLIIPILSLIAALPKSSNLLSSLLNLVLSLASGYFIFMSTAGASFVAYCILVEIPIEYDTAYTASHQLFWRIVAVSFLLLVFIAPFVYIITLIFQKVLQIRNSSQYLFISSIPLFIFEAMRYFPITDIIANDSKLGKSLKTAWTLFSQNFSILAIVGLLLITGLRVINLSFGMFIMLFQNNFELSSIGKLNFMNPYLSFPNNNFYVLVSTVTQAIWQTYSISIFSFAYLRYTSANMSKHSRP
jgi:hypothetical protein